MIQSLSSLINWNNKIVSIVEGTVAAPVDDVVVATFDTVVATTFPRLLCRCDAWRKVFGSTALPIPVVFDYSSE